MLKAGILTISDKGSRGERQDTSGQAIREILAKIDASILKYEIVPDEKDIIEQKLKQWADNDALDHCQACVRHAWRRDSH